MILLNALYLKCLIYVHINVCHKLFSTHLFLWFPSTGPVPAVFWQEINTGRKSVLIICTFTITINNQSQDLNLYL